MTNRGPGTDELPGLAGRAPVQPAAGELFGPHRCATHQAAQTAGTRKPPHRGGPGGVAGSEPRASVLDKPCRSARRAPPEPSAPPGRSTPRPSVGGTTPGPGCAARSPAGRAPRPGTRCPPRRQRTGPATGWRSGCGSWRSAARRVLRPRRPATGRVPTAGVTRRPRRARAVHRCAVRAGRPSAAPRADAAVPCHPAPVVAVHPPRTCRTDPGGRAATSGPGRRARGACRAPRRGRRPDRSVGPHPARTCPAGWPHAPARRRTADCGPGRGGG